MSLNCKRTLQLHVTYKIGLLACHSLACVGITWSYVAYFVSNERYP